MRVGLNDQNAYYDGTQTQFGKNTVGQWITSIDVVAHEFGHGVDDRTPGGISGGGTQEFIGDALATATEYYDNQSATYDGPDHTIGEEINLVGQGPIRDGSNPANAGDPSCYTSSIPTLPVHAAAGPGDHWFYLLSRGGVSKCDGTSTTGIGEQAAIKVLYNAMLMKTSSSNYLKYRTWTLTAAKNLDSTCAQFNAVKNAWDAVNVPAQTADPTCGGTTTPPTTPPTGGNILGNPGFESGATVVDRHHRPDHHQHRSPGPHRLLQGLARRQRHHQHRDDQPVGDDPLHRDRGDAVVLDPDRHRRVRLDGVRHHAGAGRGRRRPPPRCALHQRRHQRDLHPVLAQPSRPTRARRSRSASP